MSGNSSLVSMFPQIPGLDEDLENVGILLENNGEIEEQYSQSPEIGFSDLCKAGDSRTNDAEAFVLSQITGGPDSGELTPVSFTSEFEYHHLSDLDFGRELSVKLPDFGFEEPESSVQKETEMQVKEFFTVCEMHDSHKLSAEIIKKRFSGKLNRLEMEEEDEGDKTITTFSIPPRESIVGFFTEEYSSTIKNMDEHEKSECEIDEKN